MRHCIASSRYILQLINSGRLRSEESEIKKLLGEINNRNGKRFRNLVLDFLSQNTSLKVIHHEVVISPNGHLVADKNYGDCDILAYDTEENVLFNLECKVTEQARNIHEMKKEMDAYLGRPGQKKKVAKHVERDQWLKLNTDLVKAYLGNSELNNVKSLIVTSEIIPTRYLRSKDIDLPIISYRELMKGGAEILHNCS